MKVKYVSHSGFESFQEIPPAMWMLTTIFKCTLVAKVLVSVTAKTCSIIAPLEKIPLMKVALVS